MLSTGTPISSLLKGNVASTSPRWSAHLARLHARKSEQHWAIRDTVKDARVVCPVFLDKQARMLSIRRAILVAAGLTLWCCGSTAVLPHLIQHASAKELGIERSIRANISYAAH